MPLPRGLIGVVHLRPLPGDPRYEEGGFAAVREHALRDLDALAEGGAAAIVLENFGSAPFVKGVAGDRLPPHQVAALAVLAREAAQRTGLPIGVNCLRSDGPAAVGIAAIAGCAFVRVNVHTGVYVTDQGLIEGEAARTLGYRRTLGVADRVAIAADVLVKHARPLVAFPPDELVRDAIERGLADAVIATGARTGAPVDETLLATMREAAGDTPLWIGSGLTPERAARLAPYADAAIVGSWLKRGGRLDAPVDPARVRAMAEALRDTLRRPTAAGRVSD
ncbi:MAG: phosphorybosylanthranilate isomerase [Planctomycetota bacterium]|nr:MAG: phosphorybosylanthranilate isomerase [Planctomycetota bacterium]